MMKHPLKKIKLGRFLEQCGCMAYTSGKNCTVLEGVNVLSVKKHHGYYDLYIGSNIRKCVFCRKNTLTITHFVTSCFDFIRSIVYNRNKDWFQMQIMGLTKWKFSFKLYTLS